MSTHFALVLRFTALIGVACVPLHSAAAQTTPLVAGAPDGGAKSIIVVVREPQRAAFPRWLAKRLLRGDTPSQAHQPGLTDVAQALDADGRPTGIYVWRDAASARAFVARIESDWKERDRAAAWDRPSSLDTIGPRWFEREEAKRAGSAPEVRFFQVVSTTEDARDGLTRHDRSAGMAAIVVSSAVPESDRAQLLRRLEGKTTGQGRPPGLLRSYVAVDQEGSPAGISFWKDEAAARAMLEAQSDDGPQTSVRALTAVERYEIVAVGSAAAPHSGNAGK
jgi:hypothetical protein